MEQPYNKYKDSGVEWIGEIPESWTNVSLKYIANTFGRIGYRGYTVNDIVDEGNGAISLSPSNINNQKLVFDKKTFISWDKYDESPEIQIFEGDVVLVKTASVGKATIIDNLKGYKATINPQLVVFKEIEIDTKYFYYTLISDVIQKRIESETNGGVVGTLTQQSINTYSFPKPSPQEQTQIAAYLDYHTRLIDALIAKKETLIQKLQEQRQAIINEAVTKGLNPEVELKKSDDIWLSFEPKHWLLSKIKYVAQIKGRIGFKGYTKDDLVLKGQGALTLGAKHIDKENNVDLSDPEYISWEKYYESPEIMVKIDDVIFTQRGSLGKVCHINKSIGEATINPSMVILSINDKDSIEPRYLYYWLISSRIKSEVELLQANTAVPMISQFQLSNFPILLPPKEEQNQIIFYIDKSLVKLKETIDRAITSIQKLKEYRQSLISEAVTGKIDVREWQQPNS